MPFRFADLNDDEELLEIEEFILKQRQGDWNKDSGFLRNKPNSLLKAGSGLTLVLEEARNDTNIQAVMTVEIIQSTMFCIHDIIVSNNTKLLNLCLQQALIMAKSSPNITCIQWTTLVRDPSPSINNFNEIKSSFGFKETGGGVHGLDDNNPSCQYYVKPIRYVTLTKSLLEPTTSNNIIENKPKDDTLQDLLTTLTSQLHNEKYNF